MNMTRPMTPLQRRAPLLACGLLACLPCARAEVNFTGIDGALEANARALIALDAAACDTSPWRVERLFRDADEELLDSLQALGYYNATFTKQLTWADDCWHAAFDVVAGEPVRYRLVEVMVDGDAAALPFSVRGQPAVGDVLDHGRYERFKSSLITRAGAYGYFDAAFTQKEIVVDRQANAADLRLRLEPGSRYRYGDIRFTEGILRDGLLRRYAGIKEGEYYDAAAISKLYDALTSSGYFKTVSVRTEPVDESALTVPVDVILTPSLRRNYSVGAGFATDTGPQGRLGYINRRRNDKGHQFEARLFVSDTDIELTGHYRWPVRDPRTDWASIAGGFQHQDTDTSESDTIKIGYYRTQSFAENWLWSRYVDYAREQFTIADQDDISRLLMPGVNFESAIGREISRTTNGRRINVDIRGASDALGSDTNFLQVRATARWIHSLNERARVITRGRVGATAKDALAELPVSVRFFTGGDRNLRGYDYQAVGPVDANGIIIGGSYVLEASLEFDYLVAGNWAVATFADIGSAFNSRPEFSRGVGVGVRWYSPVGPIRLDFAHPLDDPDNNFRIHVVLGPDL